MKVLDLFSGIGGFSLGLERAGFETMAFCEIESYPRSILKKHWPKKLIHKDIRKLNGYSYRGSVGLICGGFPCQPFSVAGKQEGQADDRHLWPEMFRLIKEARPDWVIGENVAGFIKLALDDVLSDLESEGYTAQSFVIPACAVGGIHRRDRVWIVAHSHNIKRRFEQQFGSSAGTRAWDEFKGSCFETVTDAKHIGWDATQIGQSDFKGTNSHKSREDTAQQFEGCSCKADVSNANNDKGTRLNQYSDEVLQKQKTKRHHETPLRFCGIEFRPAIVPTEPAVRCADDGIPQGVAMLKALGNTVMPQIPEILGLAIQAIESKLSLQ